MKKRSSKKKEEEEERLGWRRRCFTVTGRLIVTCSMSSLARRLLWLAKGRADLMSIWTDTSGWHSAEDYSGQRSRLQG